MVEILAFVMPVKLTSWQLCNKINEMAIRISVDEGYSITFMRQIYSVIGMDIPDVFTTINNSWLIYF